MRRRHKMAGEYTVLGYLYRYRSDKRYRLSSDRVNMATLRFLVIQEFVILREGIVKITPRGMARWLALDQQKNNQKHTTIAGMYHAKQD